MAVVYLATLRGAGGFEKRLVVKQIRAELASDEAFVERLVAEAKTTVGLSHPNIVPVYELGVEQGVYFIAMELAQGVTLAELLTASGRLSPEEGAYLGVEICRALDYAHRKAGIVHRDATPRNVLVDDEGAVRLIDFGIAAPATVEGAARERVFGSPGHMPIEQLRGGRLTPATDVFAVGALLIEAWTGVAPFRRAEREESDAALVVPPPAISDAEPLLSPLNALIARAVAFDAAERPQTAEELARPLREFLRSADLGDISRRLGARVRSARRASVPRMPSDAGARTPVMGNPTTRRGSLPSVQTSVTRPIAQSVITETFAARDEVAEWAQRASERPPPSPAGIDTSDVERGAKRGPLIAGIAAAAALALGVFFVATRSDGTRDPSAGDKGSTSSAATARAADSAPLVTASPAGPATASASASAGQPPAAGSAGSGAVRVRPPVEGAAGARAVASSSPTPPASAEGEEAKIATFTLTADLAARVTIDGASFGVTPIRGLRRAPGRHVVTLVSVELDERLTTSVDAKPGQAVNIHAEFTRPVPALRVR